ncbi:hypothetical protein [Psychrobacillus sp. MER TA 171]|uniref:hypothetical protein n=1 Tax=Psychrobacillus sp. MER TA 171 TaxID=2939577 RepID=UPI0020417CBC|nr:hypothetical protein [Psychrobacillus sp. MER TA 171]MCM3356550.1 hypothetical protein [Psychrobacillus sp. MER TA 171]
MNLHKSIMLVLSILCVIILILSYFMWKDKLENAQNLSKTAIDPQIEKVQKEEPTSSGETTSLPEELELTREELVAALSNADAKIQELVLDRYDQSENIQMLIVGSTVMNDGNPGYGQQLSEALTNTYGSLFEITLSPWDVTSEEFVETHLEEIAWDTEYDLVLMEPFTLNNNGLVTIEDEHDHILAVQERAREEVEDTIVMLQPPHPFYQAQFYLTQVRALETFANDNDIPYINHWTDWPATDDVAITEFLTEDNSPNSDGANLWSSFLSSYFTSQ